MRYYGLCIGGPLDGQYAEHTSNTLRLPQEGEVVTRADGSRASYQPNLWFTYQFNTRYWVPYDMRKGCRPLTEVLDILDREYVQSRSAKVPA